MGHKMLKFSKNYFSLKNWHTYETIKEVNEIAISLMSLINLKNNQFS